MKWLALLFFAVSIVVRCEPAPAEPFELKPDAQVSLQGRSYPFGLIFGGTAGYSQKLYSGTPEKKWRYGYVRAAVNAASIGVVNRIGGELQVYPISIFGFSVGQDITFRNFKPQWIDCATLQCTGRMHRLYLRGLTAIGAKGVTFLLQWRYERIRSFGAREKYFDELTILSGRAAGETELTLMPIVQYKINDQFSAGAMALHTRAINTKNTSLMMGPLMNVRFTDWTLAVGAGTNQSSLTGQQFNAFVMASLPLISGPSILEQRF